MVVVRFRTRSRQVPTLPPQLRPSTVMPKPQLGPSRLSQILKKLKANPKPVLTPSLKSLKLTYAVRNEHFGARCVCNDLTTSSPRTYSDVLRGALVENDRHFVRDDLPRIQYANPTIAIEVNRVPKAKEDTWQSSLLMEFGKLFLVSLSSDAERASRRRVEEDLYNGR